VTGFTFKCGELLTPSCCISCNLSQPGIPGRAGDSEHMILWTQWSYHIAARENTLISHFLKQICRTWQKLSRTKYVGDITWLMVHQQDIVTLACLQSLHATRLPPPSRQIVRWELVEGILAGSGVCWLACTI
jgi:hypothetical protein